MDEKNFLASYHQNDYDRPSIAVDTAIFTIRNEDAADYRRLPKKELSILLVKRGEHPYLGSWALPGGFVRKGESLEDAVSRELHEETGVSDIYLSQLHTFSNPFRDPRGWIMSCSYIALAPEDMFQIQSGGDAVSAEWFNIEYKLSDTINDSSSTLNRYILKLTNKSTVLSAEIEITSNLQQKGIEKKIHVIRNDGFAFDHAEIIAYAISYLREELNSSMLAFELLPGSFTLTELQQVYETILDENLLPANFRRKIAEYVTETQERVEGAGHRPSKLFKRRINR